MTAPAGDALLEVRGLAKTFRAKRGWPVPKTVEVRAIDGVSFSVGRGEALGIVGESGCGKSTVARACLRLIAPDKGEVRFDGADVVAAGPSEALAPIPGQVPTLPDMPAGCRYQSRCPLRIEKCAERPPLNPVPGAAEHGVRCWVRAP